MQPEREVYVLSVNLGLLLRGPVGELQTLLDHIRDFVNRHPEVHLVFKDLSGDPLRIERGRGRP